MPISKLFPFAAALLFAASLTAQTGRQTCNVRDYGATGRKSGDATAAMNNAVEACAKAGGGTVYVPPGEYTTGSIRLKSHITVHIDAGATLFASLDPKAFDKVKGAVFYGEDLQNITLEGRGTVDGQAQYEWRTDPDFHDFYIAPNTERMRARNKPLLRSFPKNMDAGTFPRMVLLIRCKDVRITGLNFLHSRSWNINPYACERVVIDGVYIYSSLKEAVWADGIDPDGCKDVRIANSTIVTGDDAVVFYSSTIWGPALPCENITVSNCRLSSASSAIKFCDGNANCVRKVTIDNTAITDSNRGLAFMVFDGGYVSDVVISNLTIECNRKDWFWWGDGDPIHFNVKRRSEIDGHATPGEPPPGAIRNVLLHNIVAHGMGTSSIMGHPGSWLDGVTIDNVKLFLSEDPRAPYPGATHALQVRYARNFTLRNFEVTWDKPASDQWESALAAEDVQDFDLDGFSARQGRADAPVVMLGNAARVTIRNSKAQPGTGVFVRVKANTKRLDLVGNDFRAAKAAYRVDPGVRPTEVKSFNNLAP